VELALEHWGNVDYYSKQGNVLVLLEIEKGQKHPNTNVLKVWPFLEENREIKILLIQIIHPENKAPKNRLQLCKFTGKKLEEIYPDRFKYLLFHWHPDILQEIKDRIKNKMDALI
jgi:hypothetical protein